MPAAAQPSEATHATRETREHSAAALSTQIEAEVIEYLLAAAANHMEDAAFALVDAAGVTPSGFASEIHARIFAAVEHLYTEGESVSPTRIAGLIPAPQQDQVLSALNSLRAAAPLDRATFEHHLAALARHGHQRELSRAVLAAEAGLGAGEEPEAVEDELRKTLDRRAESGRRVRSQAERWELHLAKLERETGLVSIEGAFRLRRPPLGAAVEHAEHPAAAEWRAAGKPTFAGLLNGGLRTGELVALAGGAGIGKSTFALQLADAAARANVAHAQAGAAFTPVLYLGLELDGFDLLEMSLARLAAVNVARIHAGAYRADPAEHAAVTAAQAVYLEQIAPYLRVFDSGFYGYESVTIDALKQQVRRLKADFVADAAAVFIDPVQRLITGRRTIDREPAARLSEVAQGLHTLAKRENVAVVLLADSTGPPAQAADGEAPGEGLRFRDGDVLNHLAATTLYLAAGGEVRELFPELWKRDRYMKFMYAGDAQHAAEFTFQQKQLARRLENQAAFPLDGPGYDYRALYASEFAALLCAKQRWAAPLSLVFHYHKAIKCFEELPI